MLRAFILYSQVSETYLILTCVTLQYLNNSYGIIFLWCFFIFNFSWKQTKVKLTVKPLIEETVERIDYKMQKRGQFFLPWSWLCYVDIKPMYPLGIGRTLNVHKKFIGLEAAPQRSSYIKVLLRKTTIWNHSSAWVLSCEFAAYFQNTFSLEHPWKAASGGHPEQPLNVLYTFNLQGLQSTKDFFSKCDQIRRFLRINVPKVLHYNTFYFLRYTSPRDVKYLLIDIRKQWA